MQEREEAVREEKERRNAGEASPVGCGGPVAECRLSCKMENYHMKTYISYTYDYLCGMLISIWK